MVGLPRVNFLNA